MLITDIVFNHVEKIVGKPETVAVPEVVVAETPKTVTPVATAVPPIGRKAQRRLDRQQGAAANNVST